MFKRGFKNKRSKLDEAINDLIAQMQEVKGDSEEYTSMADNLSKLYEAKAKMLKSKISKDTLVVVGSNLVGIVIILAYEEKNIITSKAMKFISQGRV